MVKLLSFADSGKGKVSKYKELAYFKSSSIACFLC